MAAKTHIHQGISESYDRQDANNNGVFTVCGRYLPTKLANGTIVVYRNQDAEQATCGRCRKIEGIAPQTVRCAMCGKRHRVRLAFVGYESDALCASCEKAD